MLTHRAPSSFWVLTNWTHTQAVVERTQGAAESEGRAEPGLPWQPVGGAAGEPQTGGALLLGSPQGKMEWGGEKLWPVCWWQVLFLHWLNSQPTELFHLSKQGSLHFFQNGRGSGGLVTRWKEFWSFLFSSSWSWWTYQWRGRRLLFYTRKWVQGEKSAFLLDR